MTSIGGLDLNPGESYSFTYAFSPAINLADVVKLEVFGLSVTGSVDSVSSTSFAISKAVSAQLPAYALLDARITVNDDDRVDIVELQTGAPANSSAVSVTTASSISLSAGAGITLSPNPITGKGSISAIGAAGQGIPSGGSAGQVLAKSSSTDYAAAWSSLSMPQTVLVPEPGSSNKVTTSFTAWCQETSSYRSLIAQTFYQAYGGNNATGDILLRTGVQDIYAWFGYMITQSGAKRSLPFDSTSSATGFAVTTSGDLYLQRGSSLDDADDGYQVTAYILETS